MDSVPYVFCEDVLERLSRKNLNTMAELLGHWGIATQRFLEKCRTFNMTISKDDEGWWYSIADENTRDMENGPHSHEEFLSMDRRYVEFHHIFICVGQSDGDKFRCSKEEIVRRVVPFLILRMRPDSTLVFMSDYLKEITLDYYNMFRSCFSFRHLDLVYVGPESEEFLALQLQNNPFLCSLTLCSWPQTDATEQLLLIFLNSRGNRLLFFRQSSEIQPPLKITIEFVKAAVQSWVGGGERRALFGNAGVTREEILSIPLPENVTRTEKEGEQEGDLCVRYTKEDGSSLTCEVRFSIGCISINSA
ncbi:hypothetical protein QR680_010423 [Steinernema hermaphroditum]|uniref:F-box domain-containing protein n=1 Tax=Steinernema hermaphroditum TaxID=289476 RepID=A0AA39IQD1_9BILA|nr:hypothetical protein QR680_010423 [Steinernema hermaphroditum]